MTTEVTTRLLPLPWLAALLLVASATVVLLSARDRKSIPRAWGIVLVALRLLLVVSLLLLVADPVLVRRSVVVEPGEVIVTIDASRSFSLGDSLRPAWQAVREARALGLLSPLPGGEAGPSEDEAVARARDEETARSIEGRDALRRMEAWTRFDLVRRAFSEGWIEDLARRGRVSLYGLAAEMRHVASIGPEGEAGSMSLETPAPEGGSTDLGSPLATEVGHHPAEGLAGVILVTDGHHNAPGDPRAAASGLSSLGIPFIVIGVGALEEPPDLRLESIDATGTVFAGDDVSAQIAVAASGLPALDLPITISEDGRVVRELIASIPAGAGVTRLPVTFGAGEPGRRKFTFSFPPQGGEVTAANNSRDLWLEVLSRKARVLYLDGGPRYEERYLRASWTRDDNIELARFLVTPPPDRRLPPDFPRKRDELFSIDVLVLGDVDPSVFAREEREWLRDFVTARGGALVLIAGERDMPYSWADTPLSSLLPVELVDPRPPPGSTLMAGRDGFPLVLTPHGQVSEITRLVPGRESNLELWELLPPPTWISPVAGVKAGAEVLAEVRPQSAARLPGAPIPPPRPDGSFDEAALRLLRARSAVLVTHVSGAGRVLYLGMDSTWKWRYRFGEELHRRFWSQVVRWTVSSRLSATDDLARLGTNRLIYPAGAPVVVEALVLSAPGKPLEASLVDAVIVRAADGRTGRARLEPVPRSGGRYRGTVSLEEVGLGPRGAGAGSPPRPEEYRVLLDVPDLPGYSERGDRASAAFVVEPAADLEAGATACNVKLLGELAAAGGGTFLPFSRFREAAALLRSAERATERVTESRPWDRPGSTAAFLLALLAAEWVLRKRRNLV